VNDLIAWSLVVIVGLGITVPVVRSFIRARQAMDRAFQQDLRHPDRDTGSES
jgi:hypothetical protein